MISNNKTFSSFNEFKSRKYSNLKAIDKQTAMKYAIALNQEVNEYIKKDLPDKSLFPLLCSTYALKYAYSVWIVDIVTSYAKHFCEKHLSHKQSLILSPSHFLKC